MPSTASETLISLVLYTGVAALGIAMLMMLFVLFFRLWSIGKSRSIRRFNARWEELLGSLDHIIPPTLPAIRPGEMFLFLKLWSNRYEHAEPTGKANLLALAAYLGLETTALTMLENRNGDHKILAMRTLGHLKSHGAREALVELLNHPNPIFSLLAARALVHIEAHASLDLLMPNFIGRKEWPINKILLILDDIAPQVIAPVLLDALAYTPDSQLPRLIRLFSLLTPERAREAALALLKNHTDPEIIAACLHYTLFPQDKPMLLHFLTHGEWAVRMHAVKALAPLVTQQEIEQLLPLLTDRAWWVRYHTARAIVGQPFADEVYLDGLESSLADRFARDALRQARSKRRAFEHL